MLRSCRWEPSSILAVPVPRQSLGTSYPLRSDHGYQQPREEGVPCHSLSSSPARLPSWGATLAKHQLGHSDTRVLGSHQGECCAGPRRWAPGPCWLHPHQPPAARPWQCHAELGPGQGHRSATAVQLQMCAAVLCLPPPTRAALPGVLAHPAGGCGVPRPAVRLLLHGPCSQLRGECRGAGGAALVWLSAPCTLTALPAARAGSEAVPRFLLPLHLSRCVAVRHCSCLPLCRASLSRRGAGPISCQVLLCPDACVLLPSHPSRFTSRGTCQSEGDGRAQGEIIVPAAPHRPTWPAEEITKNKITQTSRSPILHLLSPHPEPGEAQEHLA